MPDTSVRIGWTAAGLIYSVACSCSFKWSESQLKYRRTSDLQMVLWPSRPLERGHTKVGRSDQIELRYSGEDFCTWRQLCKPDGTAEIYPLFETVPIISRCIWKKLVMDSGLMNLNETAFEFDPSSTSTSFKVFHAGSNFHS